MLRRFLIVSLLAHTVLVATLGPAEPSDPLTGRRLLIDLIGESTQTTATIIQGASVSASADHTGIQQGVSTGVARLGRTATAAAAPAKQRAERRLPQAGKFPRAPAAASPQQQYTMNDAGLRSVGASAEKLQARPDNTHDTNSSINVKARLIQVLRENFSDHYPTIARRYGWQGSLEMHLRVESDGRLSHIKLVRSSGYASLDKAALGSAHRIVRVAEAEAWLKGAYIDLLIPVEYRLNDS